MNNDSSKTNNPTVNSSVNPTPKKAAISPWIFAVGAVLLLIIGFLTYSNVSKSSSLDQKMADLQETETLRLELENQFNQSIADLEDMRTSNEELNVIIENQKAELEAERAKISSLLNDKSKLKTVRKELDKMKVMAQEYLAQVEALQSENELLTATNTQLGEEKNALNNDLQSQVEANAQLSEARAVLTSEKTALSEKNAKLNATVTLASVVKVRGVQVEGYKEKGSGKMAKRKSADDIDNLQVCFQTTANEVTKNEEETFFVRLIDPSGETLAMQDKGSGMTKNVKTGEQVMFTKSVVKGYKNQEMQVCLDWQTSEALANGTYQVEVYNKGHLAGTGSFELK